MIGSAPWAGPAPREKGTCVVGEMKKRRSGDIRFIKGEGNMKLYLWWGMKSKLLGVENGLGRSGGDGIVSVLVLEV